MVKTSDLRVRDVINIIDGKRLGNIIDVEFDLETGRITSIIVPGPPRIWGLFARENNLVIPWEKIKKIGADVILVEVPNFTELKHDRR